MTASKPSTEIEWMKNLGRMRPWEVEAARSAIRELPHGALGDLVQRLPAQVSRIVPPGAGEDAVEDIMRIAADVISVFRGRDGVADLVAKTKATAAPWQAFVAASQGRAWDEVAKALKKPARPASGAPSRRAPGKATQGQIRQSIKPDALVSFENGKSYKVLKPHLTAHGMTIAEYKAKWGLPNDYPTTAPAYREARAAMASAAMVKAAMVKAPTRDQTLTTKVKAKARGKRKPA